MDIACFLLQVPSRKHVDCRLASFAAAVVTIGVPTYLVWKERKVVIPEELCVQVAEQ